MAVEWVPALLSHQQFWLVIVFHAVTRLHTGGSGKLRRGLNQIGHRYSFQLRRMRILRTADEAKIATVD